jgi:hypothetical protein
VTQFYETTVLVNAPGLTRPGEVRGVALLSSPSHIGGRPVDYSDLVADIKAGSTLRPIEQVDPSPAALSHVLSALSDPGWGARLARLGEFSDLWGLSAFRQGVGPPRGPSEIGNFLLTEDLFAAERSPLTKHSIQGLASGATVTLVTLHNGPMLVIAKDGAELSLLYGLGVVTCAIWDEIGEFSGDAVATLLDVLRRRFGIKRRRE